MRDAFSSKSTVSVLVTSGGQECACTQPRQCHYLPTLHMTGSYSVHACTRRRHEVETAMNDKDAPQESSETTSATDEELDAANGGKGGNGGGMILGDSSKDQGVIA